MPASLTARWLEANCSAVLAYLVRNSDVTASPRLSWSNACCLVDRSSAFAAVSCAFAAVG